MRRHWVLLLLLVFTCLTVSGSAKGQHFMKLESRLVNIPTGTVLEHGIFTVGTYLVARIDETQFPSDNTLLFENLVSHEELVVASAFYLNFGLFDRVEVGLGNVLNGYERYGNESFTTQAASLKLQLLKEQEVGAVPSIAMGIEYQGEGIFSTSPVSDPPIQGLSPFLAVSKTLNLPRIHQFSGHIGVGGQRYAFEGAPVGLFVGLSKEFQPAFARGDITLRLAFDVTGVNAGVCYVASSGLQVALGAETLNNPDELRYLASVSWTNKHLHEQIDEMRRSIQRVAELAAEAKRAAAKASE